MKRIILSISTLILVGAAVAGGTGAFFSDTEISNGNTFTAGAIDLKIDNTSYYNGVFSTSTSWSLTDLTIQKFFDFLDLKPGDKGEDTISLHVDTNDAYLCANVKLTSNNENGCNEPEALVDNTCTNPGPGDGELASNVNFIWWADDGDNVLESDETVISQGPIGALGLNGSTTIALADSQNNIWTHTGGPVPGTITQYIGKAWCFGTITPTPLAQDGLGASSLRTPATSNGGVTCNGSTLNNSTQTDSLTADVTFTAVQARNNANFTCIPPHATGTLTVIKHVINDNGGNNVVSDFHFFVDDGIVSTEVLSGATTTVPTGTYNVAETGVSGYAASLSGDCDSNGNVTVGPNDHKVCVITNDDIPASVTLIKKVIGGTAVPTSFVLRLDGKQLQNNSSTSTFSNVPHAITEDPRAGYHFTSITGVSSNGKSCPAILGGTITLDEGESVICTITNTAN